MVSPVVQGPREGASHAGGNMRRLVIGAMCLALGAGDAASAERKGIRFWNLTSETQSDVSMAPAGTSAFGPNQCLNDKDRTVDVDEQLRITGITPGRYDIRLRDTNGRQCFARNVTVQQDAVFSLQDKDLSDCTP
jgi:hypothetical protein